MSDFEREVYCIGGISFDAIDLPTTISRLRDAQHKKHSCFLTTPNLNFLALSQHDSAFRDSVIQSDLVIADGTPIVWMAKLLGIPIRQRVAGSSLFEALSIERRRKMSIYFLGGPEGAAQEAAKKVNQTSTGLNCVGYFSPGFGTLEDMSQKSIIDNINISNADFLVVALGAQKGQAWIVNNLNKIRVPLVSHLGAVINFEAQRLKRAPFFLQKIGLEWAWRIKEEPKLWKRYWHDGLFFLELLMTKILPHAIWLRLNRQQLKKQLLINSIQLHNGDYTRISILGSVLDPVRPQDRLLLAEAGAFNRNVEIDFTNSTYVSSGMFGLILMLKKRLTQQGLQLKLTGINAKIAKVIDWNCLTYLLD